MINSSSKSESEAKPSVPIVFRSNKLSRDPLRRALLEALTRSAVTEDDNGEE